VSPIEEIQGMKTTSVYVDRKQGICPLPDPLADYDGKEPFAEVFMALEDEHPYIRFAQAHCASWRESPVNIGKTERIVGIPRPRRAVESSISSGLVFNRKICEHAMETGDPEQKWRMQALMEYFPGRHVTRELIHEESIRSGATWHWAIGNGSSFQGHMVIDYAKILRVGIPGLRREIEDAMSACDDPEKVPFYQSLLLYCDNMSDLCRRYAEKAKDMQSVEHAASLFSEEVSQSRRDELSEIAEICESVSMRPPNSFREALQLFWFTFLLDGNDDPGRFDQFMYPFYRDDLAKGAITREFARELLEDLWYKMEQVRAWSLVLAGQTPDGEDASNDLTHLCLEVTADLRITNPAVALRLFSGSPRHLWRMGMRCVARGGGMPSLVNDDAVIRALVESGVPLRDARDYAMGGCIEFQISGKSNFGGEDGHINLAKCLELALNDGRCTLTGEMIGMQTGDPSTFKTFDDVFDAYKQQVESAVDKIITQCNVGQEIKSKQGAKLFRSLLIDDCIARGKDCEGGGAMYGNGQILTNGIVVVADSLAAIKTLVFEEKSVSMSQLLQALKDNWQGHESLRQRILHRVPQYGNDDERVDNLAREISEHIWHLLKQRRTYRGGRYTGLVVYFNRQLYFGRQTGATPDGRFSGDVLEDSMGPWPGRDTHGPTAMFRSVSRIAQELAAGGVILNLKLPPSCLDSDEGIEKSIDLIRSYFALGGQQVQVTVANADDLKAAVREPEKWRHLIVRVGGYSDYFVTLDPKLQESIIQRTEYAER
jgi:pyruvate formate-lyase/glycerol dehydratase family glycyl radical enzyme